MIAQYPALSGLSSWYCRYLRYPSNLKVEETIILLINWLISYCSSIQRPRQFLFLLLFCTVQKKKRSMAIILKQKDYSKGYESMVTWTLANRSLPQPATSHLKGIILKPISQRLLQDRKVCCFFKQSRGDLIILPLLLIKCYNCLHPCRN